MLLISNLIKSESSIVFIVFLSVLKQINNRHYRGTKTKKKKSTGSFCIIMLCCKNKCYNMVHYGYVQKILTQFLDTHLSVNKFH